MLRTLALAAALATGPGVLAATPQAVSGTWTGQLYGQPVTLQLNADGTGSLNGERGTWVVQGDTVILDGALAGQYDGQRLTFFVEGQTVVLTRGGGGGMAAGLGAAPGGSGQVAAPGKAFKPKKTLKGKRIKPAGKHVDFVVPKGWKHGLTQTEDGQAYQITPPGLPAGQGGVVMNWVYLSSAEAQQPTTQLLESSLQNLLGGAPAERLVGPESFTVGGKRAGRVIVKVQGGAGPVEGYLGGVVDGTVAYVIIGVYPAGSSAKVRPGIDTILSTFRAAKMPENTALKARLAGRCYEEYSGNSDSTGHGSSTTRHRFGADGSYRYSHNFSMHVAGASAYNESARQGTWRVQGETLVMATDKGTFEYAVTEKRGILYFDGTKVLPCD